MTGVARICPKGDSFDRGRSDGLAKPGLFFLDFFLAWGTRGLLGKFKAAKGRPFKQILKRL